MLVALLFPESLMRGPKDTGTILHLRVIFFFWMVFHGSYDRSVWVQPDEELQQQFVEEQIPRLGFKNFAKIIGPLHWIFSAFRS